MDRCSCTIVLLSESRSEPPQLLRHVQQSLMVARDEDLAGEIRLAECAEYEREEHRDACITGVPMDHIAI